MEDIARTVDSLTVLSGAKTMLRGTLDEVFRRRDMLTQVGLDVPAVTRVLLRLRAMGIDVDTGAYTLEAAVGAIKAVSRC
jgi:energy-coupling factor transport system ATP-binding protein